MPISFFLSSLLGTTPNPRGCCPIVELRQYVTHPGQRDTLITLFEQHFIESQEATGMRILGQFRQIGNPDRFVWFRGFASMADRKAALTAFYGGPVWLAHRQEANATLADNDNVLLLRPVHPEAMIDLDVRLRPGVGARETSAHIVVATLCSLDHPASPKDIACFEGTVAPVLQGHGATLLAELVTEPAKNDFERLPVREGEHVFLWLMSFPNTEAYEQHRRSLSQDPVWAGVVKAWEARLTAHSETLVLTPTPRSLLQ